MRTLPYALLATMTMDITAAAATSSLWNKKTPRGPVTRLEAHLGYSQIQYRETHNPSGSATTEFTQKGLHGEVSVDLILLSPLLWVGGAIERIHPTFSPDQEKTLRSTTISGYGKLWIPARPADLSLLAEYLIYPIGYEKTPRLRYGAQLGFSAPSGQSLSFTWYPPLDDSKQREFAAKLQLKLVGTRNPKPYSLFNGGPLLTLGYRTIRHPTTQDGATALDLSEYFATLGVRF